MSDKRDFLTPVQVKECRDAMFKESVEDLYLDARLAINSTLKTEKPNDLGIWTVSYPKSGGKRHGTKVHNEVLSKVSQELKNCGWVLLDTAYYSPVSYTMKIEFQEAPSQTL